MNFATVLDLNIPVTYEWLEYIEATGTQYIDTGVKPYSSTSIRIRGSFGLNDILYGAQDNSRSYALASNDQGMYFSYGASGRTAVTNWKDELHTYRQYRSKCYIDDDLYHTHESEGYWSCDANLYLFARGMSGGSVDVTSGTKRIYRCEIWDDNTLIRDLAPFRDLDGTIGMYDRLNRRKYFNIGTGEFVAGPRYTYLNVRPAVTKIEEYGRVLWQPGVPVTITSVHYYTWPDAHVSINGKDIYLTPSVEPDYQQWVVWDTPLLRGTEIIFTNVSNTDGNICIDERNGQGGGCLRFEADDSYTYTITGRTRIIVDGGQQCEPGVHIIEE